MTKYTLYRVLLPYACFGIDVAPDGSIRPNREIGTTLVYKELEAMRRHVEACGGTVEEVG